MLKRPVIVSLLLVLLLSSAAPARTKRRRSPPKPRMDTPEIVALKYCTLDLQGARLSKKASGSDQIHALELFTSAPPDESIVVARDCRVRPAQIKGAVANVSVEYHVLGSLEKDHRLNEGKRTETITFVLQKLKDGWHIARPVTAVHASPTVLAVRLHDAASEEKDLDRKVLLDAAVQQLEQWRDEGKIVRVVGPETRPAQPASPAVAAQPAPAAPAASVGPAQDEENPEAEPQPEPASAPAQSTDEPH